MTNRKLDARGARWAVIFAVFGLLFIEPMWLIRTLGSDDASYFAHAATVALDFDFDYSNEAAITWSADHRVAAGSPGSGWMAAPFVAAFSIVDRVAGHPVIQDHARHYYSWSFFGMLVAALVYFLLGVWLYRRALETVWPELDPRLNLLLAFSTGVPFYVLRRFTMSHAYEFFACALAVWAAVSLYRALGEGSDTRKWYAFSGLAAGLGLAVRINNLNALFLGHTVLLLLVIFSPGTMPRVEWPRVRRGLAMMTGVALAGAIPIALFNLQFFGAVYPSPASMYGQPLHGTGSRTPLEIVAHGITLLPNLIPLIFSSEFGVLYTNPVLVLGGAFLIGTLGYRLAHARDVPHALAFLAVLAYFGLNTAIVLWWRSTGTSYGYRYLFPLYPVALLGLMIAIYGTVANTAQFRRVLLRATLVLASISVLSMTMFSGSESLEVNPAVNVFGRYHSASARGYMTALPREMVRPRTWASLPSRRLIGYFAAPYAVESRWKEWIPLTWRNTYHQLYEPAPLDVTLQLLLILGGWTAAGYWLARRRAAESARTPDFRGAGEPVLLSA